MATMIIHLTLMEAKLLQYLIDNEGRAVSRKVDSRRGLAPAGRHRHTGDRQFYCPTPTHLEDDPIRPKNRPDRPRRRLSIYQTGSGIGVILAGEYLDDLLANSHAVSNRQSSISGEMHRAKNSKSR